MNTYKSEFKNVAVSVHTKKLLEEFVKSESIRVGYKLSLQQVFETMILDSIKRNQRDLREK